jgi:hypothetical protein
VKVLHWNDTYLCIADENKKNREVKEKLLKTYRALRARHPFIPPHENRLWHAHDHMFFADSTDCLGIQLADLCAYFVRRHLAGDSVTEHYYKRLADNIICAKPEPESKLYRHLFCSHEP